jgi:zinc protease
MPIFLTPRMKYIKQFFFFFSAGLLFYNAVPGQSSFLNDTLPRDPSVIMGVLPNGLRYYIRDNGNNIRNMQIRMVVNAGSLLEADDQRGLAHFMEHMNFNGLKHFPKNELVSYLESNGLKFGADLNASTGFESTSYILWLATEDKKEIDKGFSITEDWDHNALLEQEDIDKERGIVIEESRLRKNAFNRMQNIYFPVLVNHSRYAVREPIGLDSVINGFPTEALKRFYESWYRPDLTAIIVVGNLDTGFIKKEIVKHFGSYTNPLAELPKPPDITLTPRTKDEVMVLTDREWGNSTLEIFGAIEKTPHIVTWKDYRQTIVERLFTLMMNERLNSIRDQSDHSVVGAMASYTELIKGYRSFNCKIGIAQNGTKNALDALVNAINTIKKFGFLPAELERAKSDYLRVNEQGYLNRDKLTAAYFADLYSDHFTDGKPIVPASDKYLFTKNMLKRISLEEIDKTGDSILSLQGKFTLLLSANNEPIFDDTMLRGLIAEAEKLPVTEFTEKSLSNSILLQEPVSGEVSEQTINKALGTVNLLFKNGITVTLKPTEFKNDDIQMDAWRFGGSHQFGLSNKQNAEYAARLVQAMGIGRFSSPNLEKFLSGKTVSVQPYINAYEDGIEGKCSVNDFTTFLQLINAYYTDPARDISQFQNFISKQKNIFQNAKANPQNYFLDSTIRFQYQNSPWANTIPVPEDFDAINLDSSFSIYQQVFGNPYGMHFTFVGNLDPTKVRPLLETYLGSLPTHQIINKFTDEGMRPRKGIAEIRVRRGEDKQSQVLLEFTGEAPMRPIETIRLDILCDVIQIRILEKLRQEMGGIYSATIRPAFYKRPYEHYEIGIRFVCGPENADKLTQAVLDIINDVRENGVDAKYLNAVKEMALKHQAGRMGTNEYCLSLLSAAWINQEDPEWVNSFHEDVNAIRSNDLKATANRYFNMNNYLKEILLPE